MDPHKSYLGPHADGMVDYVFSSFVSQFDQLNITSNPPTIVPTTRTSKVLIQTFEVHSLQSMQLTSLQQPIGKNKIIGSCCH
jgi:hypothetical protein